MSELIPNFLRGAVSAAMNVLLMLSLLQPKYDKKITGLAMAGVLIADLMCSFFCYLFGSLTQLARIDLILFTVLCFVVRPLFRDNFMQWLFSYITVQNINMSVVVLSFSISRLVPYHMYANGLVRFVLYSGIIFVLRRYIRPLYHQMVEYWNVFFYVAAAIAAAFTYYLVIGNNIVQTLTVQAVPMHLLVLIMVAAYGSVFYSLKILSREFALREENIQIQNNQELLHLSACAMADRIRLLDDAQQKSRILAHDLRHFNNTLLELLKQQKAEDAIALLRRQTSAVPTKVKNYCENTVVNAAMCYYAGLAEEKNIAVKITLDIPDILSMDSLELAMVLSNLLDNSINACKGLEQDRERTIRLTCRNVGRLALEISNPCNDSTVLDENGFPVAKESGHGAGTKSVLAFVQKQDGEILYQIAEGVFRVRILV